MAIRKGYTRACNKASNYDSLRQDPNRHWEPEVSEASHAKCSGYIGSGKSRHPCQCKCHKEVDE